MSTRLLLLGSQLAMHLGMTAVCTYQVASLRAIYSSMQTFYAPLSRAICLGMSVFLLYQIAPFRIKFGDSFEYSMYTNASLVHPSRNVE